MRPLFRPATLFFLFLFLSSCAVYQRYQLPKSNLLKIDEDYLTYYLVDAAHPLTRVWYMSDCKVRDKAVDCYLTKMTETEAMEVSLVRSKRDARWSKDDVLFYANPKFAATLQDTCTLSIQVDQLEKIEVYELNQIRTFGTPLLSTVGIFLVIFLISDL